MDQERLRDHEEVPRSEGSDSPDYEDRFKG